MRGLQEFFQVYGLPTASVRIFSAYGLGLRRQVLWDICRKALSCEPLALMGTGKESRDFIHVGDIARALETVAMSAPMQGEVYNLASGREVTIMQLAEIILDTLGLDCQLQFDGMVPPRDTLKLAGKYQQTQGIRIHTTYCTGKWHKVFCRVVPG
jgi:UDP-glucose 4-epimerase